jgi:hypothetical protein
LGIVKTRIDGSGGLHLRLNELEVDFLFERRHHASLRKRITQTGAAGPEGRNCANVFQTRKPWVKLMGWQSQPETIRFSPKRRSAGLLKEPGRRGRPEGRRADWK